TRVEHLRRVPPWLSNPMDSPFRAIAESGYPFAAKVGQTRPPNWANSEYRNHLLAAIGVAIHLGERLKHPGLIFRPDSSCAGRSKNDSRRSWFRGRGRRTFSCRLRRRRTRRAPRRCAGSFSRGLVACPSRSQRGRERNLVQPEGATDTRRIFKAPGSPN